MNQLHDTLDKLGTEFDHMERLLTRNQDAYDADSIRLALSVAKRVRRESSLLVRQLAAIRDQLQP